jgi:hypothetical protein
LSGYAGRELRLAPDAATLDELLERINTGLTKRGPITEMEVMREPQKSEARRSVR